MTCIKFRYGYRKVPAFEVEHGSLTYQFGWRFRYVKSDKAPSSLLRTAMWCAPDKQFGGTVLEILEPEVEPHGAILVIHSWWGLTESFRLYGRRFAQSGYLVGLVDLFAEQTADTENEARRLRLRPRRLPMYKELGGNIRELRTGMHGKTLRVGVVGFSMGGHWAVWLSQRPQYRVSSTILYYAARGGDFSKCKADIQAHFAEKDHWVSKSARTKMETAIISAGCSYKAFDYPQTSHWFAEASRIVEFDAAAARLALDRDIRHFERTL